VTSQESEADVANLFEACFPHLQRLSVVSLCSAKLTSSQQYLRHAFRQIVAVSASFSSLARFECDLGKSSAACIGEAPDKSLQRPRTNRRNILHSADHRSLSPLPIEVEGSFEISNSKIAPAQLA